MFHCPYCFVVSLVTFGPYLLPHSHKLPPISSSTGGHRATVGGPGQRAGREMGPDPQRRGDSRQNLGRTGERLLVRTHTWKRDYEISWYSFNSQKFPRCRFPAQPPAHIEKQVCVNWSTYYKSTLLRTPQCKGPRASSVWLLLLRTHAWKRWCTFCLMNPHWYLWRFYPGDLLHPSCSSWQWLEGSLRAVTQWTELSCLAGRRGTGWLSGPARNPPRSTSTSGEFSWLVHTLAGKKCVNGRICYWWTFCSHTNCTYWW